MARDKEKWAEYMRKYTAENKDKINARRRKTRQENPERFKEQDRTRHKRNPIRTKLQKYKITKEQYLSMIESQGNKCAICHKDMAQINIDHCHSTGKVRGLLCTACNTGIGKLKEDIDILRSAIKYLTT